MELLRLSAASVVVCALLFVAGSALAAAPTLLIDTPRGGELYVAGQNQVVRLGLKTRSKAVTIELSTDGGATFTVLGTINNTVKDRSKRNVLPWTVPAINSTNCVVRATDATPQKSKPKPRAVAVSGAFTIGSPVVNGAAAGALTASPGGPAGGDLAGEYPDPVIAAGAVNTGKLADGAVTTAKLNSGAASANFILTADGIGGSGYVAPDGLFPPGSLNASVLTPGSITQTLLAVGSVSTSNLADGAVTTPKLADGAVTTAKLAPNAVNLATQVTGQLPDANLATISSAGKVADSALSGNVTLQGNTFNAPGKLVQLDANGKLPAADGSNLTGISTAGISGTLGAANGGTGLSTSGAAGNYLRSTGAGWSSSAILGGDLPAAGTPYVTSVGLAAPAEFTVSGSPLTGSGTLTLGKAAQAANQVYAGPAGGAAAQPAFRVLVASDVPNLDAAKITTGTLAVANGGTGASTAGGARTALGAAASGANSDITSLSGLTTPLSIAQGGTGASNSAGALANLGAASAAHTHVKADLPASIAYEDEANTFTTGVQTIQTGGDGNSGLLVRGNSVTQSANLQEWQSSAGTVLAAVTSSGTLAGGTAASRNLTLDSTTNATKGNIIMALNGGSVGIGAIPGATLDVNGTARVTGFTLPTGAAAGRILVSDGAGNGTWQPAGAVGNWSLTGNAGTTPGTNFIGTTDAQDFVVKTSGNEAARVKSDGTVFLGSTGLANSNVGIGTNTLRVSPDTGKISRLQIDTITDEGILLNGPETVNKDLKFRQSTGADQLWLISQRMSAQFNRFEIFCRNPDPDGYGPGSVAVMSMSTARNVGIRTAIADGPHSTLHVNGSLAVATSTKTADYTATDRDSVIVANGTFTVTLPSAAGIAGRSYTVRRTSGTVTVASASTLTGNTSLDGTAGKTSVTFISDGAGWVSTVQF